MHCPECGQEIKEGSQFCENCGAPAACQQVGPVCANCGSQNQPEAVFCVECGARLGGEVIPMQSFCPECGAAVKPGAAFCKECGADLNATTATQPRLRCHSYVPNAGNLCLPMRHSAVIADGCCNREGSIFLLRRKRRQQWNTNRRIRRKVRIITHNKTGCSHKHSLNHKRRIGSIRSNRRSIRRRVNLSHRFNSRGGHNNRRKNPTGTKC